MHSFLDGDDESSDAPNVRSGSNMDIVGKEIGQESLFEFRPY
jgi:hypothetical protein